MFPLFRRFSGTATTLAFDGRQLHVRGAPIPNRDRAAVEEILRSADCRAGTIALRKNGRIACSRGIPESLHQRIRNLLFSP